MAPTISPSADCVLPLELSLEVSVPITPSTRSYWEHRIIPIPIRAVVSLPLNKEASPSDLEYYPTPLDYTHPATWKHINYPALFNIIYCAAPWINEHFHIECRDHPQATTKNNLKRPLDTANHAPSILCSANAGFVLQRAALIYTPDPVPLTLVIVSSYQSGLVPQTRYMIPIEESLDRDARRSKRRLTDADYLTKTCSDIQFLSNISDQLSGTPKLLDEIEPVQSAGTQEKFISTASSSIREATSSAHEGGQLGDTQDTPAESVGTSTNLNPILVDESVVDTMNRTLPMSFKTFIPDSQDIEVDSEVSET